MRPQIQEKLDAIRNLILARPMISQKDLAAQLDISCIELRRICATYADYIGYTTDRREKSRRVQDMVRKLIAAKPQSTVDELMSKAGLSRATINRYLKEHPEWGRIAATGRSPELYPKMVGRKVRRSTPITDTELEVYKIQRAAEAAGYGANSYGAFLASIDYKWDDYKRRHRKHG